MTQLLVNTTQLLIKYNYQCWCCINVRCRTH